MSLIPWPTLAAGFLAGALVAGGVQQWRIGGVTRDLQATRDALTSMQVQRDGAVKSAQQCSAKVDELARLADARARAAEATRKQAATQAAKQAKRADQILAAPPAHPGDACASAQAMVTQWLRER